MSGADALAGRHVMIVGGGSGMGLGVTQRAARAGARLTLLGRDQAKLKAAADRVGGAAIGPLDLRDAATIPAAVAGDDPVDHLVITAGSYSTARIAESAPEAWRGLLEERLIGPLSLIKALGPRLTTSIVIFTGLVVRRPTAGAVLAAAALGGVEAAVRALAVELAPVRVNAVSPGMVDTPMLDAVLGARKAEVTAATAGRLPARRIGTPDDAAGAALFLMCNPFITGTTLELDGGAPLV